MFTGVEVVIPVAVQLDVPVVNAAALGALRTKKYAIGAKSSGNAGNCGASRNAPAVVVTPKAVLTMEPWQYLMAPARLTPATTTVARPLLVSVEPAGSDGKARPVAASVVGEAWAVCAPSVVPNLPLITTVVVTVVLYVLVDGNVKLALTMFMVKPWIDRKSVV